MTPRAVGMQRESIIIPVPLPQSKPRTLVRRRLIARVLFARRSRGAYFLFLYNSLRFCRAFWFMTVRTRAIDLRTPLLCYAKRGVSIKSRQMNNITHILVSFAAEPPAIFCTRSVKSSFLSSVSCFDKSFFDLFSHVTDRSVSRA